MDIEKLLTKGQQHAIIEIIKEQCYRFQRFEEQFDSLFYGPYVKARHKHTVTSAILSGFAPNELQIDGIQAEDLPYGMNDMLTQPELKTENGIFHIYSNGSDLKGKKIFERSKQYNANLDTYPVFFMIIVEASNKGVLNGVKLCIPNAKGKIVEEYPIYQAPILAVATA